MRICFVTTGDIKSLATSKRATGMAGPLTELGHEVAIVMQDTPTNRVRLALECPRAEPLFFTAGSVLAEVKQKRALLRHARPDVLYTCAFGARNSPLGPSGSHRPLRLVEHSELRSSFGDEIGALHANRERLMEYATLWLFDGLLCASRYLERTYQERLRRFHLQRPILYSTYAYNEAVMLGPQKTLAALRTRFAGRRVVIYIGAMTESYGLFELLESMTLLRDTDPEVLLLLLGRQSDARVARYIADKGLASAVEVLDYVPEDELSSYFGIASAFVSTLRDSVQDWARCPSKLFIYLPFERPIVTCRIGEAAELLGDSGYYYQPGNTAELAEHITEAVRVPATWRPDYDYRRHSWRVRSEEFLAWLDAEWDFSHRGQVRRRA